ncbi:MAG: hypothetical protein GY797_29730 [Deltaproteobacteria bacterium]|nr:hypothetical protein [Deltaproteobacteria bacterium]
MRRICYWFCVVLIGSCLAACDSTINTNESDINVSHPIPIFPSQEISSNYVHNLRWSVDSQILFFKVDSVLWTYGILTEITEELASDNLGSKLESEQAMILSATPSTLNNIPDGFYILTASPSGRKALVYQVSSISGRNPSEKYEGNPYVLDVWIWEDGTLKSPGTIEICGPNQYIWAEGENFVGIQAPLAPAHCDQSSGWLIDISQNEVFSILPMEIYHANSTLHSFSPESDKLLIRYGFSDERGPASSLQIFDLETHEVSQLTTPVQTDPVDWFSNNNLLVLYKEQLSTEVRKLAFLDIKSNQIVDIIDPEDLTTLNGQYIAEATLSPDKNWIAFTIENQRYETSSLWIIQLNSDK